MKLSPSLDTSVQASALSGALGIIVLFLIDLFWSLDIPPAVSGAIVTVITVILGFFVSTPKSDEGSKNPYGLENF